MPGLLLVGGNGQVGHEIAGQANHLPLPCEVLTRADLDVTDRDAVLRVVERSMPDVVVNATAYTAVDKAESDADTAFAVNCDGPAYLSEACARVRIPLIHISTDYVYDGAKRDAYREDDPVSPLGVYGASKLAGEEAVRSSGARHLIFRTAWVYATHGSNFLRTMLRLAREREELRVVADQFGSPTPAALIADVTAAILAQSPRASGTWHLTATGETSWHGFASAIVDRAHGLGLLARMPAVTAITTAEYPTPARRPARSCLDCARLQRDFGVRLPDWRAALDTVLV